MKCSSCSKNSTTSEGMNKRASDTFDFLQVAQGLREGYVYTHPTFSSNEYLVLDAYGDIRIFDNYEVARFDVTPELILSTEWTACDKHIWTILETHMDFHLVSDNVYLYYQLSREEDYERWEDICLSKEDLVKHQRYVTIEIGGKANLRAEEREKIAQLLRPNLEKEKDA